MNGVLLSDIKKNRGRGRAKRVLVSILTSDTDYQLQLPCPEYLRLKRLQNSVRISAEVIQEKLQKITFVIKLQWSH